MNWKDFVAALVKSLAWPATVLALVFYFREEISGLLSKLKELSFAGLKASFSQKLEELKEEAKAIDLPRPDRVHPRLIPEDEANKNPSQLLLEARRLALIFPEPAVALAWEAVETQLAVSVAQIDPNKRRDGPAFTPDGWRRNAHLLRISGEIDDGTYDVLRRMHNLRNMAVHGGQVGSISTDEAQEFLAFAEGVVEKLRTIYGG